LQKTYYSNLLRVFINKNKLSLNYQLNLNSNFEYTISDHLNSLNKLNLMGKIAIIGIAKRLEEIYFPNDSVPLYLDKRSETLRIIQQIRDEAHRFGITHHRNKRSRETFKTELNEIKGISEKTAEKLLIELKSVTQIKSASLSDLEKIVGYSKAKLVYNHFNL
jgi:excinuclease ABC subunit C